MAINGTTGNDTLIGGAGDDLMNGLAGDDSLTGNGGNDTIDGGTGNDTISGGLGNNTYLFGKGDGQDLLSFFGDTTFGKLNTIQFKTGVAVSDVTAARSGDDLVLKVAGVDSITVERFFLSDDPRNQYNPLQQVKFADGTVWNLDKIITQAFVGSTGVDSIVGTIYADTIDGRAGTDTINGGLGNNIYLFGKGDGQDLLSFFGDTTFGKLNTIQFKTGVAVSEVTAARSGDDLVLKVAGVDSITVERFFLSDDPRNQYNPLQQVKFADGTVWNLDKIITQAFVGSTGADSIVGTINADIIDGRAGTDTLSGGLGNNIYLFGKGDGQDLLSFFGDTTFGKLNTIQFKTGVAVSEVTAARSGDDLVLKVAGVDSITVERFFLSDDPRNQYNPLQQVKFADGTVWNLDKIITQAFVGSTGADSIVGTIAADTIDGRAGTDTLSGGFGNNTYLFGKGDGQDLLNFFSDTTFGKLNTIQFKSNVAVSDLAVSRNGSDLILTISATDSVYVERFFFSDDPSNQYNPLQQIKFADGTTWNLDTIVAHSLSGGTFTGTVGDDILIGTLQADHFFGGLGNDTYFVNNAGDVVTESSTLATEIDTVNSSVSFTLGSNIENLNLIGAAAINGTGNSLGNLITGNSAANILDGKASADILIGGGGNDTYVVENSGDLVVELAGGGTDGVQSSISYILPGNVESLILTGTSAINGTGNSSSNVINGNSANNVLDGATGTADTVSYSNAASAVTVSLLLQGTAQNTLGAGSDTLINFENLTGSSFNDTLTGNTGNNVLNGGVGADRMTGGAGNDSYVVDNTGDVVTEAASGGTDTVQSGISYVLGVEVENLQLTGTAAINGTGNAAANSLAGNGAANLLAGKGGNDILTGGAGADGFTFDTALGTTNVDRITDFAGVDDQIRLDDAVFTRFAGLTSVAAGTFVANAGGVAADANDYLLYDTVTGRLYYDTDGNGVGAKVQFAQLDNLASVSASDFTIV